MDDFAPICFTAGAYGAVDPVWVSPQHRILVGGWRTQLFCGEDEVLIAAKALVDGHSVVRMPRREVTYIHLLFESHQIVRCQGLESESYFPGATNSTGWDDDTALELETLFPEIEGCAEGLTARAVPAVRYGAVLRAA